MSCCAKFSAITYPSCFSYSIKSKENQTTSRGVLTLNIDATKTWHLIFPVISYCPPLLYFMLHHFFCHNIFTYHAIGCVISYFLSFHISCNLIFPIISYFLSFKISFHLIFPVISYFLASHISCTLMFPVISYFLPSHMSCHLITVISYFLSSHIFCHLIFPVVSYFLAWWSNVGQ